jgi:hypothetical protein
MQVERRVIHSLAAERLTLPIFGNKFSAPELPESVGSLSASVPMSAASHATKLLAQAEKAHDSGDHELAEMFTTLAMRYLDEAEEEAKQTGSSAHIAQQQQQPQGKKEE